MKISHFTIYHGFLGSLALHCAAATLLLITLAASEPDFDDTLVVEFRGADSDVQAEEKNLQQTLGAGGAGVTQAMQAGGAEAQEHEQPQPQAPAEDAIPTPAQAPQQGGATSSAASQPTGLANVEGAEEQQSAQTVQRRAEEQMNALRAYVKVLSKKIQSKLIYPKEIRHAGLQGVTTVSFRIRNDGGVQEDSLKIVASSGKEELDRSALSTIRACAPFAAPPREMTISIAVTYSRKR
jgi:periplasmic protein TonB